MPKTPADIANETLQVKRSSRLQKIHTPDASPVKETTLQRSSSADPTNKGKKNPSCPDYTNYVLSYSCPETERPGTGVVGKYDHERKRYEVQFTFTDNKDPYTQVDYCPRKFVEDNLVEPEVARKWLEAVAKQQEIDTPRTRARKRGTTTALPKIKNKNQKLDEDTSNDDDSDPGKETTLTATPTSSSRTPSRRNMNSTQKVPLDPGILALIYHAVREATYDVMPNAARLRPFMYWNGSKGTACAKMLIKRTPSLRLLAEKFRRNEFARLYATKIRLAANNERSAQIRQLKLVYLSNDSDFSFVSDYQMGGHHSNETSLAMRIHSALRDEFETIEDLRDALFSYNMYNFPKLFDLFCAGMESGKIRGIQKVEEMTPIEDLVTVAHEAHFRCELWYTLVTQAYRHDASKAANEERFKRHQRFCFLVAKDRRENGTNAFNHRNSQKPVNEGQIDSSSDDDTGVDNEFY